MDRSSLIKAHILLAISSKSYYSLFGIDKLLIKVLSATRITGGKVVHFGYAMLEEAKAIYNNDSVANQILDLLLTNKKSAKDFRTPYSHRELYIVTKECKSYLFTNPNLQALPEITEENLYSFYKVLEEIVDYYLTESGKIISR